MTHAPASSLLTTKNDSLPDSVILNTIIECQERYSKEYSCQGVSFFKPMKWDLKGLPEIMDLMGPIGPKGPHEPTGPHKPQGFGSMLSGSLSGTYDGLYSTGLRNNSFFLFGSP